jgi:hypothetical protein
MGRDECGGRFPEDARPASIVHRRAHALGHLGRIASYGCWHRGAWIVRLSGPKLKQ